MQPPGSRRNRRPGTCLAILAIAFASCTTQVGGPNLPPVADAGGDLLFTLGVDATAILDGNGSQDPEGVELDYHWDVLFQPENEDAGLENPDAAVARARPRERGVWLVGLTVNDGALDSARDIAWIFVRAKPCVGDSDCDNQAYCDGTERCTDDLCEAGEPVNCDDGDACTLDLCDEAADSCENVLQPVPGAEGPPGDATCSDGVDNDCDESTDGNDPNCGTCTIDEDCADGDPCTAGTCDAGVCSFSAVPEGTPCDDGLFCDGPDECDALGACVNVGPEPCTQACQAACSEVADECAFDQPGLPCDGAGDGYDCSRDLCDGLGNCISVADDANCTAPELCLPGCAVDGTGCVRPPSVLGIACRPAQTGEVNVVTCSVGLGGLANQAGCLRCSAEIGLTTLDESDFVSGGACDLNGWELMAGADCSGSIDASCNPQPAPEGWVQCCNDWSAICSVVEGEGVLTADRRINCLGANLPEWRLRKTFDTRGFHDLELCFLVQETDATSNDRLLVFASDAENPWPGQRFFCQSDGPGLDDNDLWYQVCRKLPDLADDDPAVVVTFLARSEESDDVLRIKRVSLRGLPAACDEVLRIMMSEDFTGCSGQLPEPAFGDWEVSGPAYCPGFAECCQTDPTCDGQSIQAADAMFSITRYVDAEDLDDRIHLDFHYGDSQSGNNDFLDVEYNAGLGWFSAWKDAGDTGPVGCRRTWVNLSELEPAANNNPNLGIRFTATTDHADDLIDLADIHLKGLVFCDGGTTVTLSSPAEQPDQSYEFDVTNHAQQEITARITCEWGPAVQPADRPPIRTTGDVHLGPGP